MLAKPAMVTGYRSLLNISSKQIQWILDKALPDITLSKQSISLDSDNLTDTFTITTNSDGNLSITSSDDSIATVSLSGNTVTVEALADGSTTIIVNVTESSNYLSRSTSLLVNASFASTILNDNSWATISSIAKAGTASNYWSVGDVKMITLNGKIGDYFSTSNLSVGVFILDFNHEDNGVADSNIIFGGFKSARSGGKDIVLCDSRYGHGYTDGGKCFNMNHWEHTCFGGWKGSDLRYDILGATSTPPSDYGKAHTTSNVGYDATEATLTSLNADTFISALSSDLRNKIRLRTHYVDNVGYSSRTDANVTAVTDAVFLLTEFEIFGSIQRSSEFEQNHQAQMKYYVNGNSRVKYKYNDTGTDAKWSECSPFMNTDFCNIHSNGMGSNSGAGNSLGLAPAFKI